MGNFGLIAERKRFRFECHEPIGFRHSRKIRRFAQRIQYGQAAGELSRVMGGSERQQGGTGFLQSRRQLSFGSCQLCGSAFLEQTRKTQKGTA